jgi:hypothetical protein
MKFNLKGVEGSLLVVDLLDGLEVQTIVMEDDNVLHTFHGTSKEKESVRGS